MSLMRSFLYRFPRFRTECPMDFIFGDRVVLGTCLSISESGLRGTLSAAVPAGTAGVLTLYDQDRSVQIESLVDSVREEDVRVRFRITSDIEKAALRDFIKLLKPR